MERLYSVRGDNLGAFPADPEMEQEKRNSGVAVVNSFFEEFQQENPEIRAASQSDIVQSELGQGTVLVQLRWGKLDPTEEEQKIIDAYNTSILRRLTPGRTPEEITARDYHHIDATVTPETIGISSLVNKGSHFEYEIMYTGLDKVLKNRDALVPSLVRALDSPRRAVEILTRKTRFGRAR